LQPEQCGQAGCGPQKELCSHGDDHQTEKKNEQGRKGHIVKVARSGYEKTAMLLNNLGGNPYI
jgi:hypothetical protein